MRLDHIVLRIKAAIAMKLDLAYALPAGVVPITNQILALTIRIGQQTKCVF